MIRRTLAAALVLVPAATALAQDERALSGKDDLDFANALEQKGYPDLAERFLGVIEKKGGGGADAKASAELIRLNMAQTAGVRIDDPLKRLDALDKVRVDKQKFIETNKGRMAAEDCRNALPDLYGLIGEAITAAIKKTSDEASLDKLRERGNRLFMEAAESLKARRDELQDIEEPTEEDQGKYIAAYYNYCRTIYLHALLYAPGSGKRKELAQKALDEYGEFDLEFTETLLNFYAYVDMGLCLKELEKFEDAIDSFDQAIVGREWWGERDKNGVWPLPPSARDVVDIVCYAMLQKMILLKELKRLPEVIEVGRDYLTSIPDPYESSSSMNIARLTAESMIETGDRKGAEALAQQMLEVDPNGYGGVVARDLIERMGGGSYQDRLKNVAQKIETREIERALVLARDIANDTRGTPDEAEAGCQAFLLMGTAYERRGWYEEAALAFQTALDRYPRAKDAAEVLVRAINAYNGASRASRRRFYADASDELMNRLIRDYPKDPRAQEIQFFKAGRLESDGDYAGAIQLYEAIQPSSNHYTKARLLIGIDEFNWGVQLSQNKETAEQAKSHFAKADAALRKASEAIAVAAGKTIDPEVRKALTEQDYIATMSLAKLLMIPAYGKMPEATPVIDRLEKGWGSESAKSAEIQNLRGRWFLAQGKIEEAEKWVNDLYARDKLAAAIPAGQVAAELDRAGLEKIKAKPDSIEGDDLWKRAAKYYYWSVKPQVDGTASQDTDYMIAVAGRFFVFGQRFNGIPDDRVSFVDWVPGTKRAPDYFEKAAEIFDSALQQAPDYRMAIGLGRCHGFLGQLGDGARWVEAARVYAALFAQEAILTKDRRKLDSAVTGAKPELTYAYLEWGVAERMAYAQDNDKSRLTRCLATILTPLVNTLQPATSKQAYWGAKYHQVRALMDAGDYVNAKAVVDDVKRTVNPNFDDGEFGYKAVFDAAAEELSKK